MCWPWQRHPTSLAQSLACCLFWVGVTVLHQHSGLLFCDSLFLRRKWMEVSHLGTADATGTTWEELLLCCSLSPPWPIADTQLVLWHSPVQRYEVIQRSRRLPRLLCMNETQGCRIIQSGAGAKTACLLPQWAVRLALLLPSSCACVSLLLVWWFNSLDEWDSVISTWRLFHWPWACKCKYMQDTLLVGWLSRWRCLWAVQELNLALQHLTLNSWILLGRSAEQTPMLSCYNFANLVLHFVSMRWWKIKGFLFWARWIISCEIQAFFSPPLVLCPSSKLGKMSCFQAALQPHWAGVCIRRQSSWSNNRNERLSCPGGR